MIVCTICKSEHILQDARVHANDTDILTLFDKFFCLTCNTPCLVEGEHP